MNTAKRLKALMIFAALLLPVVAPFVSTVTANAEWGDSDRTFALKVTEAVINPIGSMDYVEPYYPYLSQGFGDAFSGYRTDVRSFTAVGPKTQGLRIRFYVDSNINGITGNGALIDVTLKSGGGGFDAGGLWFAYESCDLVTSGYYAGQYYADFVWKPGLTEPQTNRFVRLSRDIIEFSGAGILTSVWDDRLPPGQNGSKMTAYRLNRIDMRSARVDQDIFVQMSPIKYTLTPNLSDLKNSAGGATGLGYTHVFLDIDTDFLLTKNWTGNSAYYYRYDFGGLSLQSKPWIKAEDRNTLEIPEELRNKPINLWLEVCDILGNRIFYANGYAAKGAEGACKPVYNTRSLLAGDSDMWTYIIPDSETAWPPTAQERAQAYNNALQEYVEYGNTPASMRYYFKFLSVFLGIQNYAGTQNGVYYTGTPDDIDMQFSGYQWSRSSASPDYGEAYIPWDRYYKGNELDNTGGYLSGYRCIIEQYPEETGEWYLWLLAVDKRSGGANWRKAENVKDGKTIDFVYKVAGTPPTVKYNDTTVVDCDKPVFSFKFESDFGLGYCAYQICPDPNTCDGHWHPETFGVDNGNDVGNTTQTHYIKVPFGAKSHTVNINVADIDFSSMNTGGGSFTNIVVHAKVMDCREYDESWLDENVLRTLFNSPGYGYRSLFFGAAPQFIPIEDKYRTVDYQNHTVVCPVQPYYSVDDNSFPYQYFPRIIYVGAVTRSSSDPFVIEKLGPANAIDLYVSMGGADDFGTSGALPFKPNLYYRINNRAWTDVPANGRLTIKETGNNTLDFKCSMTPDGRAMGGLTTVNATVAYNPLTTHNAVVTYPGLNDFNVKLYPMSGSQSSYYHSTPVSNDAYPADDGYSTYTLINDPDFNWTTDFNNISYGGHNSTMEFYTRMSRPGAGTYLVGNQSSVKFSVVYFPDGTNMRSVPVPSAQRVTEGKIVYSSTEQGTTKAITAYIYVGLPIEPHPGVIYEGGWASHTFDGNGSFIFDVTYADNGQRVADYLGGVAAVTASVGWMAVDRSAPACPITIEYEYDEDNARYIRDADGYTNRPVTVKLNLPSPNPTDLRIVNNYGSDTLKFLENGSFTFEVMDKFGSVYYYLADVRQINKTPPTLTLVDAQELYSFYKGMDFETSEPGYSARDWLGRDITGSVVIENNIDPYKGGYQTITYTATDSVGNSTTEYRAACVFDVKSIELLLNGIRLSQQPGMQVPAGAVKLQGIGNESPFYEIKYLEGDHKVGEFKEAGVVVKPMDAPNKPVTLTLTKTGVYSLYIRDYEGNTFVGQILVY